MIPYLQNLNIDAEDSVILNQYTSVQNTEKELDIVVVQYPKISNFTDVDPFLPNLIAMFGLLQERINYTIQI